MSRFVEITWKPSDKQLRQFGYIGCLVLPVVGWFWTRGAVPAFYVAITIGVLFGVLGRFSPKALRPVFVLLSLISFPIGLVVSELAMLTIYFCAFLPLGLVFRLLGRDALQRTIDRGCQTYWEPKQAPNDSARYYQQW